MNHKSKPGTIWFPLLLTTTLFVVNLSLFLSLLSVFLPVENDILAALIFFSSPSSVLPSLSPPCLCLLLLAPVQRGRAAEAWNWRDEKQLGYLSEPLAVPLRFPALRPSVSPCLHCDRRDMLQITQPLSQVISRPQPWPPSLKKPYSLHSQSSVIRASAGWPHTLSFFLLISCLVFGLGATFWFCAFSLALHDWAG